MVTHAHREAHLFFYVSGQAGAMSVAGRALTVDPLNAVAVSPWEPHSFEPCPKGSGLYLVLYIRPEWFATIESFGKPTFRFGRPLISLTPSTVHWVQRLSDMLVTNEKTSDVDEALYQTMDRCFHLSWNGHPDRQGTRQQTDRRICSALELLDRNYTTDVDMDWLARASALSRPHFFKLFKQETGVTPNIYLNTLRSEHAIGDLLDTPKSVTEISLDLGFSSQASFTRFFCSNVGITPTEYRRVAEIPEIKPVRAH